jgi:CheY-like chemotaxis protein
MSAPLILVIDDSATIRKMVDSHLSQEGYRVMLAPNGEVGFEMACELKPDLILLDHQLPGTTGIEVCRKIIAVPECESIPFLVSSTLRKQAYIEYMDVPNVVDSLPKPFKPEMLKVSVANALETASMIVSSQTNGTAVPEVVGQTDEPALTGDFRWLGLREVIDFLNNGRKDGMLEVETERNRVLFFLKDGRIQGVVSPSFNPSHIADQLPETLRELAPLLQFTLSSGASTQVDGLVQLMDKRVLDPRMLRTLLRQQAAILTRYCFLSNPTVFSFLPERPAPTLFQKASIDCCLAAILVDGSAEESPADSAGTESDRGWVRNSLRGQNLDRTGLSARHVQLLSRLDATSRTAADLAAQCGLPLPETNAVLEAFLLADWVENKVATAANTLIAFETETPSANGVRCLIEDDNSGWTGNVVRDEFSFQLLLKRKSPHVILIALEGEDELDLPPKLDRDSILAGDAAIVVVIPEGSEVPLAPSLHALSRISRPFAATDLIPVLNEALTSDDVAVTQLQPPAAVSDAASLETAGAN